eukprot:TRINITY_DN2530_c0_g2_i8.p2 TRINITY_DN2530_c0_g2~~TRINITY_DN2530_c0_g2_i8.p2  ORF type:complete len:163 (-),score=54.30 TRINITY_DN2530_c0_g2_i8:70-558(-)
MKTDTKKRQAMAAIKKKAIRKPAKPEKPERPQRSTRAEKKTTAKRKVRPQNKGYAGYSPEELKKYLELKKELSELTNEKLKEILRANSQSMSGSKNDLIEKVADGEVLGATPRCSKCGGGHLKWNNKKGQYHCNGYMDDTVWKNCRFKGTKADVVRTPWVKP